MRQLLLIAVLVCGLTHAASAQYSAVRVNTLGLTTGTVNVGVDVALTQRWSVEGSLYWNPIQTNSFSIKSNGFSVGGRYWRFEPHVGSFVGFHSNTIFYDYGGRKRHYKGWMTGVGVSYGYSRMLSTRWNFIAEIGVGCYYMKDRRRDNRIDDNRDIVVRYYQRLVVAPSKLELAFSYLF